MRDLLHHHELAHTKERVFLGLEKLPARASWPPGLGK
jgi:hypothetical protein